ncbi:MAG TPA: hypothetical protein VK966_08595, partial [Longimicrobiales bacterium]|nr:hypothetical protein [Longimicrobiales bacterium]
MNKKALVLMVFLAGCGTDVAGPSTSLFSCVLAEVNALSPGESLRVRGASNQGVCLGGDEDGAEFVYIPFLASAPSEDGGGRLP